MRTQTSTCPMPHGTEGDRMDPIVNKSARLSKPARRTLRRCGMGLVELMIALAISASLLTAVGMALDASFKAYRVNEEQSSLIQQTRLTLNRITTAVRASKLHQPHTAALVGNFSNGLTVVDTGLDMIDANNVPMTFTSCTRRKVSAVLSKNGVVS